MARTVIATSVRAGLILVRTLVTIAIVTAAVFILTEALPATRRADWSSAGDRTPFIGPPAVRAGGWCWSAG
jgi:hypothetical protein